ERAAPFEPVLLVGPAGLVGGNVLAAAPRKGGNVLGRLGVGSLGALLGHRVGTVPYRHPEPLRLVAGVGEADWSDARRGAEPKPTRTADPLIPEQPTARALGAHLEI